MSRVSFSGVSLDLPPQWFDVSDDLPAGSPPTLSKGAAAVGALQFSIGRYKSGPVPSIGLPELGRMLHEFFGAKNLGAPIDVRSWNEGAVGTSGDHRTDDEFIRVWYISEGSNIALITFTCMEANSPSLTEELGEADRIARSVRF